MNKIVLQIKDKKAREHVGGFMELSVLNPFVLKANNMFYAYTLMLNLGKEETYFHGYVKYENKKILRMLISNNVDVSLVSCSYYCPSMYLCTYF